MGSFILDPQKHLISVRKVCVVSQVIPATRPIVFALKTETSTSRRYTLFVDNFCVRFFLLHFLSSMDYSEQRISLTSKLNPFQAGFKTILRQLVTLGDTLKIPFLTRHTRFLYFYFLRATIVPRIHSFDSIPSDKNVSTLSLPLFHARHIFPS